MGDTALYLMYVDHYGWIDRDGSLMLWLLGNLKYAVSGGEWTGILYSTTVILPTTLYLGTMSIVLVSMLSLRIGKVVISQLFRLDIETEKSIFYYTGLLLGLMTVLIKVALEVLKLDSGGP